MARIIKLAGFEFELLTDAEAANITSGCAHQWELSTRDIIVNPGGEFVKGYGSDFVSVQVASGQRCSKCGLFEATTEISKYVRANQSKLKKILKMKPVKNKTICEVLRQLRKVVDKKHVPMVDYCLLAAKKMDGKLRDTVGPRYTATWYDKDGNFIV